MSIQNNKAIIKELAAAYEKENKSRNRILVLAITISIFLLYSSFSIASGKIQADYLLDVRGMGTIATVSLENGSSRQYEKMKSLPYLKAVGIKQIAARGTVQDSWSGSLIFLDQDAYEKIMRPAYTDVEGEYPQKENEIMMSERCLTQLGIQNPQLGMDIFMDVEFRNGVKEEKPFQLSGYYKDYTDSVVGEVEAFISKAFLEKNGISMFPASKILAVHEDLQTGEQIEQELYRALEMEYDAQQVIGENPMVMQSVRGMFGSIAIAAICGCIVVLCAYMVIYNVISISFGRDVRQYGLLKALGTTNQQLRNIMYRQNLKILVKGVLVGGISGGIFVKLFLSKILSKLFMRGFGTCDVSGFYPVYLLAAVLLVCIVCYCSTAMALRWVKRRNAIEAMRYIEADGNFNLRQTEALDKLTLSRLAWRNISRSKKRLCLTALSLILGCFTAMGSVVIMRGTDTTHALMEEPDFQMGILTGIFRYPEKVPEEIDDNTPVIPERTVDAIQKMEGIKKDTVIFTKGSYAMINFDEDPALLPRKESLDNDVMDMSFATLQIVDRAFIERLESYVQEYNLPVDIESLKDGTGTVLIHHHELSQALEEKAAESIGLPIHFYSLGANQQKDVEKYLKGGLSCAGYLDMTDEYFPDLQTTSLGNKINYFIMSREAFSSLGFQEKYFDLSFDAEEQEEPFVHQKLMQIIQKENQSNESMDTLYLNANSDVLKEKQEEIQTANLILGVLSATIFFVGMMNYFNTILTSLVGRTKEFAVLEGIGLTRIQLWKMLLLEGVYYWLILVGAMVTVGSALLWALGILIKKKLLYFQFIYPWRAMLCMALLLLLVCVVLSVFMYRKSKEQSITERLKRYID